MTALWYFLFFFQLQRSFCFVLVFRSDMSESDVVLSWSELNCSSDYSITILHRCVGLTTTVGYFKLVLNWTLGEYTALKVCFSCIFTDHFSSPVRAIGPLCMYVSLNVCPDKLFVRTPESKGLFLKTYQDLTGLLGIYVVALRSLLSLYGIIYVT